MSRFIPLKRSCPVCDGVRKDCRQSRATGLIHCRHSEANPIDYVFRGLDAQGFGMWADKAETEAHSEEQREEWRRQQQFEKQQRLEAERQQRAQLLSESERDRENCKVFNQLGLAQRHREDLERRGLSEELIKVGGFKSVEQWQKLDFEVSFRLAGVFIDGRSLITQAGYIWPIKNPKGQILGWQIRKDNDKGGRFAWATSATRKRPNGPTVHLRNGELPLACHRPATGEPLTDAIELTEGTGVKPFITAQRLNRVTLGAAGGNFIASQETFKSYLDELSQELRTKQLILNSDAGAVSNPHVMASYQATHALVTEWGYELKFRWWNQLVKSAGDIDEIENPGASGTYLGWDELVEIAVAHGGCPTSRYTQSIQGKDRTISRDQWELRFGLGAWLKSELKGILGKAKGFGKLPALPNPKQAPDELFHANQRLQVWQDAVNQGYRYILDISAPGLGKSHTPGVALPDALGVEKLWYLSNDHRNPTTAVIESNYVDLPIRHNGLKTDYSRQTPNGNPFLRHPKEGEQPDTQPNCFKTDLFRKLQARNWNVEASESSPICQTCKLAHLCKDGSGGKYGASFRGDRKDALASARIRAHADSMPHPDNFDYASSGVFWDEVGVQFRAMDSVTVTLADFDEVWAELEQKAPHLHETLKPVRLILRPLLSGETKQPYHGFDDAAIRALLPQKPDNLSQTISELETVLEPDLSFLKETPDSLSAEQTRQLGISKAQKQLVNRYFRRQVHEQFSEAFQRLALNWLVPFLKVWNGERGALRCEWEQLIIFTRSERHASVARSAKFNIFMDATMTRERLALLLGIKPSEIYVVQQETPNYANLRLIQVVGMGKLGKDRSSSLQERVAALRKALEKRHPFNQEKFVNGHLDENSVPKSDIAFGDWKSHADKGDGQWFINLRGSNEFQSVSALAVFGVPYQNVGHLQALYQALTGEYAPLNGKTPHEGLQRFIDSHVEAEIEQSVGRLRAHQRPNEQLTFYFIGDYRLDFLEMPVEEVAAFELCEAAGTPQQKSRWAIWNGYIQLRQQSKDGAEVGANQLARQVGITKGRLSQIAKEFNGWEGLKRCLDLLFNSLHSESKHSTQVDEDIYWLAQTYLPLVLELPPLEALREVAILVRTQNIEGFKRILTAATLEIKSHLLSVFLVASDVDLPSLSSNSLAVVEGRGVP